ncbi:hypothetical protein L596_022733 [Steinernema carpocapsae]|uniref:Uncharacterized protein n=1 Tax=Steinernema carpocapsae TaxID=34508 RepID=A0A4U5MMI0_STECR|nr:hypothetical protein L596_022733 [Steinernema carpocapsae]
MSAEMPMIYPKWIEPVVVGPATRKHKDVDVKDPSRLKKVKRVCTGEVHRLTAVGKEALVTLEPCGDLIRSYRTDFYILDGFWHTFKVDGKEEQYLCLFGTNAIEFHSTVGNENHPFPLPMNIKAAFSTKEGILLQRSIDDQDCGTAVHVYALTHPIGELTPVVVTGKDEFDPHFAFSGPKIEIVGCCESGNYVLVRNAQIGQDYLYRVRPCTKTEKIMPKDFVSEPPSGFDLHSIMEASMHHTPAHSARIKSRRNSTFGDVSFSRNTSMNKTPSSAFRTPIHARVQARLSGGRGFSTIRGGSNMFDGSFDRSFGRKTPINASTPIIQVIRSISRQEMASEVLDMMPHTSTPFEPRTKTKIDEKCSFLQYSGTPRIWNSVAAFSEMIDDDEKAFSLDPVAEVCLECVWVERVKESQQERTMLEKIFMMKDMSDTWFLVMMNRGARKARLLELSGLQQTPSSMSQPTVVLDCYDCAHILDQTAMVVKENETNTTFSLYTGPVRLGVIGITNCEQYGWEIIQKNVERLDAIDRSDVMITTDTDDAYVCHLAEYCESNLCKDSMEKILTCLSSELRHKFLSQWYLQNNWRFVENELLMGHRPSAELLLLFEHIFTLCGLDPNHVPFFEQLRNARTSGDGSSSPKRAKTGMEHLAEIELYERHLRNRKEVLNHEQLLEDLRVRARSQTPGVEGNESDALVIQVARGQSIMDISNVLAAFKALHNVFESSVLDIRLKEPLNVMLSCLYTQASLLGLNEYAQYYVEQLPVIGKFKFVIDGDEIRTEDMQEVFDEHRMSPLFSSHEYIFNMFSRDLPLRKFPTDTTWDPKLFAVIAAGLGRLPLNTFASFLGRDWMKILGLTVDDREKLEEAMKHKHWNVALFQACRVSMDIVEYLMLPIWRAVTDLKRYEQDFGLCPKTSPKLKQPPSLELQGKWAGRRFRHDLRLDNVAVMLDSQFQTLIPTKQRTNQTDVDFREEQEQFLLNVAIRTLSQCFGRACMIFHCTPVTVDFKLHISTLCLSGRGHPNNRTVDINHSELDTVVLKMFDWGHFYNGVSHGLSLMGTEQGILDPMWLALCYAGVRDGVTGAGVLYSFGLSGHINLINVYTIHQWLAQGDSFLVMSIMLGKAISSRGTCDVNVHKIIITHLPFMLPPSVLELHIHPLIQCAALFSFGMLFAETKHESITSQIINEMGKPCGDKHPVEHRGAYYMVGGFAIGLINLGKGLKLRHAGTANRGSIVVRLLQLMEGGKRKNVIFPFDPYEQKSPAAHVYESDNVNIHVTGLPATIAIGMIFLRTNCEYACNYIAIPNNMYKISKIRFDFLCARTMSRMLIMFDKIPPTEDAIFSQLPKCVYDPVKACLNQRHDEWIKAKDRETACTAFCYIVGGASIMLGLRYASTHDENIFKIFNKLLTYFVSGIRVPGSQLLVKTAGYPAATHCLNSILTGIALLMAGSGSVDAIRIFRNIRNVRPKLYEHKGNLIHSTYQIAHMGLGMLFMGYGRYAFGNSNMDIAALLIATYPCVSSSVADNRVYLQPLRFLWAIAAKLRLLVPVSASTTDPVDTICRIKFDAPHIRAGLTEQKHKTPCMLPNFEDIREIRLEAEGYEVEIFKLTTEEDRAKFQKQFVQQHGRVIMRPLRRPAKRVMTTVENLKVVRRGSKEDRKLEQNETGDASPLEAVRVAVEGIKFSDDSAAKFILDLC